MPEYFWEEFDALMPKLKKLSRIDEESLEKAVKIIKDQTTTVPEKMFEEYLAEAKRISGDPEDAPYVALAMALDVPLLTGDKRVIEAVRGKVKVLTLREALELL